MPTETTFPPTRAAVQVGIPPSTLRLWSRTYSEFLSASAVPPPGEERRFSPADIEVLKAIAQLRANGLEPAEIITRLRENPAEAQQKPLQSPEGINSPITPLQSSLDRPIGLASVVVDKLESVDRRLERLESHRNTVLVAVIAFAAGALVVAAVTWLLSLMPR